MVDRMIMHRGSESGSITGFRTFSPAVSTRRVSSRAILASFAFAVLALFSPAPLRGADNADNLPSIEAVLKHVRTMAPQEQGNDRMFRSRYSFVRTRTTRELDSSGRIKKQQTRQSRNNPAIVPTSYIIPAQPAPTAATPESQQKNQPKAFEKNEFVLNDDLLNRFSFKVIKREQVNQRNALLVEFTPKSKDLPARNLKDRFINKAAGQVWIDEGDWMVSKVDLYLSEPVNVAGGLVGAVKKFTYRFERERTGDGLWFTTRIDWRLEGRELFSRKILEYEEQRSEVQKVK